MKKILIGILAVILITVGYLYIRHFFREKSKPPEAITETIKIDVPESNINLPVSYQLSSFSEFLNQKITGVFLDKNIFLSKENKEEINLKLTKKENIILKVSGDKLICSFPVVVDATLLKSRYGGIATKQVKPFHTSLIITLTTPASLDKNWNLVTKFHLTNLQWIEEPVVKVLVIKKNMRPQFEKLINEKGDELTKLLDAELNKAVSLKPDISKIWFDIQKPIVITRKPTMAWARFFCNKIKARIQLSPTTLTCYTNINAQMLIITDTATMQQPNPLPPLQLLKEKDKTDESDIHLYAYTSFEEINEQLNKLLKGKSFTAGGYTIAIKQVQAYSSTGGLSVKIITDEDVKGDLVATGKLVFDVPNQTLKIQGFDFNVNTNSVLVTNANDFLHTILKDTIASKLVVNIDTLIKKVPSLIHNAIAKGNAGKTIDLTIENLEIKQCEIMMGKEKIHFKINVGTEANIRLKKLKAGKTILIKDKKKK
jgi:hypothetical protein